MTTLAADPDAEVPSASRRRSAIGSRAQRTGLAACVVTLVFASSAWALRVHWNHAHLVPVTGDEPHYIVTSRALDFDHTLNTKHQYGRDEFPGILPAHIVINRNRWLPAHGLALSLLIAPADRWFGLTGIRVTLLILALGIPLLAVAAAFSAELPVGYAFGFAIAAASTAAWIGAATQVYPDIAAGVAAAGAVLLVARRCISGIAEPRWTRVASLLALAVLPWLHLRLALPAVVASVAVAFVGRRDVARPRPLRAFVELMPLAMTSVALLVYHLGFFGSVVGPYGGKSGTLDVNPTAFSVLVGLHFDRFQGMFVMQPLLLFGVAGLTIWWRRSRQLVATVVLFYLTLVVPNALHTAWYGGSSYAGRFGIGAACVMLVPAAFGFAAFVRRAPRVACAVLGAVLLLDANGVARLWSGALPLLAQPARTPLSWYPSWVPLLDRSLPALNRVPWSWGYGGNYAGVGGIVLLAIGCALFVAPSRRRRLSASVLVAGLLLVAVPEHADAATNRSTVAGRDFSRSAARVRDPVAVGWRPGDRAVLLRAPGFAERGHGSWRLTLRYHSDAPHDEIVGDVEFGAALAERELLRCSAHLFGSDGRTATWSTTFRSSGRGAAFDLSVLSREKPALTIDSMRLTSLGRSTPECH